MGEKNSQSDYDKITMLGKINLKHLKKGKKFVLKKKVGCIN